LVLAERRPFRAGIFLGVHLLLQKVRSNRDVICETDHLGCGPSPSSAWVSNHFYPLRRLVIRNPVEQCHGTQCNPLYMKDLWPSASQFWKIIPDLKAVNNPDPSHSDPKIRGKEPKTLSKRAHNFWTHAHLTPATLGIALLFLPMWSPDLKLVERRCQDKFHCAWAER